MQCSCCDLTHYVDGSKNEANVKFFLGFLKNFGWWFDWFLLLNYDLANPNIYMKDYRGFLRNMYVLNQMISLEN